MNATLTIKRNTYQAILDFKDGNGKRKQKWISLHIRADERGAERKAQKKLFELMKEYEGIASADPMTTLFSKYLFEWIEVRKTKASATTIDEYIRMAKKHIQPYFDEKGITLAQLTAGDLEDYYAVKLETLSNNSILKQHAIIRSTLQWAFKHKWVQGNVADLVENEPRNKPELDQPYNTKEVAELLKALEGTVLYIPVMLAALFGLRRSEALGLRWSAIDFEAKTLTIKTTVVRQHKGDKLKTTVREGVTKTKSSTRTLPLCGYTLDQLLHIKHQQEKYRALCGDRYDTRYLDFVCVNQMGTLINPDYVSQGFAKALKKHGLRHIRYHDLRHSCASILSGMGYSMKDIQTWLGHSDYNFTANTYVHTENGAHAVMAEEYGANLESLMKS